MNQRFQGGNQLAYSTVAKSKAFSTQDPYDNLIKKLLPSLVPKPPNSLLASKTFDKKARKEKKRYHYQAQAQRNFGSLATDVNITNTPSRVRNNRDQKDASKAICYNYDKKKLFARNCSNP